MHVVNPDGSPSWGFDTGHTFPRAPAIGWDGTIYTFSGQTIYALRPDGSKRWASDIVGGVAAPVSVTLSGVVYAASAYLFALDPGGHQLWRSDNYFLGGAPAVGPDGTIYANSQLGATFHAFNPDGSLKWSYQAAECCTPDIPSSPAIGTDGTIYVGEDLSGAGRVYAFNPDGSVKWQFDITGLAPTSISLGGDGTIYFGSGNGGAGPPTVYALNPDGTLKWQYSESIGGYVRTTPSIGVGQRIYAGTADAFFAIGP